MIDSSYKNLPKTKKFRSYVINIYDPVNYDLDIEFDVDTKKLYNSIFKSFYTSISLDADNIEDRLPVVRPAYRCRIKGVSMQRGDSYDSVVREVTRELNKKIYLFNGWVDCVASDIDYYNRILVELYDPITGESLTNSLFNSQKYKHIFARYNKNDN